MTRIVLIFMCCVFFVQSVSAARVTVEDARRTLGKWGLSYCITQYGEYSYAGDLAAVAQGGYFQLGFHNDEEAYVAVRKYIKKAMKQNSDSKDQHANPFIQCIDIYEDPKFDKLIRRMDTYYDQKEWDNVDDAWIRL